MFGTRPAYAQASGKITALAGAGGKTLANENGLRTGLSIANDSSSILYILLGDGSPSADNFTYALPAKSTVPAIQEVPADWRGAVRGFWSAADAGGCVRVTERRSV